jgi:hypothetical protein
MSSPVPPVAPNGPAPVTSPKDEKAFDDAVIEAITRYMLNAVRQASSSSQRYVS